MHALDDVSLEVAEGEFIVMVGPSGCGKSTLLDIIAGLEKPDKGRVLADNQPVLRPGRHRLVMFQESALFPWLNVFGNVMFGLNSNPVCAIGSGARLQNSFFIWSGLKNLWKPTCTNSLAV